MERRYQILKAIIESFIISAEPIGSKFLLGKYPFDISPATIRNEMASLEKMGLIYQPYTSAGRVPTDRGFRVFVDELIDTMAPSILEQKKNALEEIKKKENEERIYQAVSLLSRVCSNVAFASIPHLHQAYYLGLSNILQKPEFQKSVEAYTVVRILEDSENFIELLDQLQIDDKIRVFIGEENVIKEIKSCSLIATQYELKGHSGVIGILGPKRMNYAYNMAALRYVRDNSF